MKLISFAAISFLAITVSAYPGLGTPSQGADAPSAEQSQDATGQSEQQSQGAVGQSLRQQQKHELQDKVDMLRKNHIEKGDEIYKIGKSIQEMEKERYELEQSIRGLEEGSPEQNDMIAELGSLSLDIDAARVSLQNAVEEMKRSKDSIILKRESGLIEDAKCILLTIADSWMKYDLPCFHGI
ncbi:hypothetical protein BASA83_013265 [Batrachochytrium salamandrivorans]|nr:hypothetical protein BASA83_013265 [Batrachochytrium salamandrivorans]